MRLEPSFPHVLLVAHLPRTSDEFNMGANAGFGNERSATALHAALRRALTS